MMEQRMEKPTSLPGCKSPPHDNLLVWNLCVQSTTITSNQPVNIMPCFLDILKSG